MHNYHRIVIKIGSNVFTSKDGLPDLKRISHLVEQVAAIKKQGKEVILVSSGAVDPSRCYHYFDSRERKFNDQPIVDVLIEFRTVNSFNFVNHAKTRKFWDKAVETVAANAEEWKTAKMPALTA